MVLKISKNHLKEFISICEALELVPEEELESSSQGGADTRATQRAKKNAHFKLQRGAEAKLQEIKERKERRQQSLREAKLQRVDCLHPLKLGRKMYLMMMARRKERLLISCTC
ncbi:PP2A regulatory subunit TAP46-like isoform X1 [Musa acuminata AAA Group]